MQESHIANNVVGKKYQSTLRKKRLLTMVVTSWVMPPPKQRTRQFFRTPTFWKKPMISMTVFIFFLCSTASTKKTCAISMDEKCA